MASESADAVGWLDALLGSEDVNTYEATLREENGVLVWSVRGEKDRFRGVFNDERTVIPGHWDARDVDAAWQPWMDVTLTKQAS